MFYMFYQPGKASNPVCWVTRLHINSPLVTFILVYFVTLMMLRAINETLVLNISKNILFYGFVQS